MGLLAYTPRMRLTLTERMARGAWENPRARRLAADERAKGLTRSAWWMMRALVAVMNKKTGWTPPVSDKEIAEALRYSPATIKRARRDLLQAGVIRDHLPGSGWTPSRYAVIGSWDEITKLGV